MKSAFFASIFATGALAQGGAWAQCGGNNWQGSTSCVSGYSCVFVNEWYSQCQPGAAPTTLKTTKSKTQPSATSSSTPSSSPSSTPSKGKFKWFGVNQSGAEFGKDIYPGKWGTEFTFPSNSALQVRVAETERASQQGIC